MDSVGHRGTVGDTEGHLEAPAEVGPDLVDGPAGRLVRRDDDEGPVQRAESRCAGMVYRGCSVLQI